MRLTKQERETIINFNELEDIAYIFTYNKVWQKHLEKKLCLNPTMDNGWGGKEYELPKVWIRPPRTPKRLSEQNKQKLARNLRSKSFLSAKTTNVLGKNGGVDGY